MNNFRYLFDRSKCVVIGMIHLRALPGSPRNSLTVKEICEIACSEAEIYAKAPLDGLLIENMHDLPWQQPEQMGPETVASMAVVASQIRSLYPHIPVGIQVLSAGNLQAMAVAKAAGLDFIRAEGFVFSHIGDEGPTHSCAASLLRYRSNIKATNILIFTDIKKKHCSHAITNDVSISETARAAELFSSDGLIVTGVSTGEETNQSDLQGVMESVQLPVLVGSGVHQDNVHKYISANGLIVGSSFKQDGKWHSDLSQAKVKCFMDKLQELRHVP